MAVRSKINRSLCQSGFLLRSQCSRNSAFSERAGNINCIGHRTLASGPRPTSAGGKEKLWQEFFSDPLQWWDHRSDKVNVNYPDFKHKTTRQALWLDDPQRPPWVEAKLAGMAPGTLQLNIFSWNKKLERYIKAGKPEKTMELFQKMQQEGVTPDSMDDAWRVFKKMPSLTVVSWSAMILGHVKCGEGHKALEVFQQMQQAGSLQQWITMLARLTFLAVLAVWMRQRM
ncbi:hypothetical protein BDL97_18G080500 [Sphagnum fallax]|nr:hypothetical protein BDL97_18G080500 [Sphagnum fallax]KAH8934385.1 hypothetical protein BDL97_18G080500 [Sphagnum fallax]KAH8934386.1 hypothetical protein BDL97_18G080500 [Sphagnum fallax]KAH8934387.1 hypothetical protein BDL97_18G080500 [Sphagnum fallax]